MTGGVSPRVRLAAGVLAGALTSCAGFGLSDLPEEPIAFVYRSREDARDRSEHLDSKRKTTNTRDDNRAAQVGVFRINPLAAALGDELPDEMMTRTFGRISLLDPRSLKITRIDSARSGFASRMEASRAPKSAESSSMLTKSPAVISWVSSTLW